MPKQLVPILLVALAAILVVIEFLDISTTLRFWIFLGVLLLLIGLRLVPFIVAPIRLYRNHWMSAQSEFEVFRPGQEVMPEEAWGHICEAVDSLERFGFRMVSHFRRSGRVSGAIAFTSLMEAKDRTTIAKLNTTFVTKPNKASPAHSMLAFFTECVDGTEFLTANNTVLGNTPSSRRKRMVLWMPETRDPGELYGYHERLVTKFVKCRKPFDFEGNPSLYMKEYAEIEVNHWVKEGYYKLDRAGELYRLTWKGAVMIAWKQLWPIKPLRRAWRRYQTNKLLRKLEE
jgi:hypothetical protein